MDELIAVAALIAGIAGFVWLVRRTKRQSAALPSAKPWEGQNPKPLSDAQRKTLGLEVPNPAKRAESAPPRPVAVGPARTEKPERATPPTRGQADHADRFSHLHPEQVAPRVVEFVYENSDGEVTSRTVTVDQVGTSHFAGHCHREGAERTFRFDRLIGPATLEDSGKLVLPNKLRDILRGYGEQELRRQQRAAAKVSMEILFTGFKKDRKAELEVLAIASGMIVRKGVTENLDILCGGYNAGPTKLAEAREKGVSVLTEDQFLRLLETGEVPC